MGKKINTNSKMVDNSLNDSEFVKSIIRRVETYIINKLYIENGDRILIAVSGGVDSVTLFNILSKISTNLNLKLLIAHFNHNLRGRNSDGDEKFVKSLAQKYGIEILTGSGDVKENARKNSLSIEQSARILRYNFLERTARHFNCTMIATAHTQDDLIETFFLNLFRGTGLTGLCSIPKKRNLTRKISIIRPLLEIRKEELIKYAKDLKLEWREDESNLLMNYSRNKIRKKLIPYIKSEFEPNLNEKISRTALLLNGADRIISDYVNTIADKITFNKTSEGFSIKSGMLNSLDEFIQGELLQHLISEKYHQPPLTMNIIDRIKDLAESNVGTVVDINKELFALKDRNSLVIRKRKKSQAKKIEIEKSGEYEINAHKIRLSQVNKRSVKFIETGNIEYIDYDLVPARLVIRTWQSGDTFSPLGMKGKMKVSDFLINSKISLVDKEEILLLTSGKEIIWVCGLRIDDRYKITNNTNKFLKLEFK